MDKNELIKKMKQGEIGFIDEPEEEKQVWEAFKKIPGYNIKQRKKELQDIEIEPGEFLVGECGILLSREPVLHN